MQPLSPPAFGDDLRTDWVPDAFGGFGVAATERPPPDEARVTVKVAVRDGQRTVPLSSIEFRAWANAAVELAAPVHEARLLAGVYGYRDHATPYRVEWSRFMIACRRLAISERVVVKVDVADFFGSVGDDSIECLPDELRCVLSESRRRYGVALLPGHRWARRAANLLLDQADRSIDAAFVRWQDDYFIAAHPGREREAVQPLVDRLSHLGMRLNEAKTIVDPPLAAAPDGDQKRWNYGSVTALMETAVRDHSLAAAKRTLRAAAERSDPSLLGEVPYLVELLPAAIPRLAMYLDSVATDAAASTVLAAVANTDDAWAASRWLAVAARHQHLARQIPADVIDRYAEHSIPALRGLIARVQRLRGELRAQSTERIDRLLAALSDAELARALPVVDTTL